MVNNKIMENKAKKPYVSVAELAVMLGISRIAVFKRIKKGQIAAEMVGKSYVIPQSEVEILIAGGPAKSLTVDQKDVITRAVAKVVKEYGETLRLLGKE